MPLITTKAILIFTDIYTNATDTDELNDEDEIDADELNNDDQDVEDENAVDTESAVGYESVAETNADTGNIEQTGSSQESGEYRLSENLDGRAANNAADTNGQNDGTQYSVSQNDVPLNTVADQSNADYAGVAESFENY